MQHRPDDPKPLGCWRSEHFRRLTAYALSNHAQALAHSEHDSREASRIPSFLPHPTSRQCTWGNGRSAVIHYRPSALWGAFYRAKPGTLRCRRWCSWPHSKPDPCVSLKPTLDRLQASHATVPHITRPPNHASDTCFAALLYS